MITDKIYIRITQACDCEGRLPYKFFAEAIVPINYVKVFPHKNIKGESFYTLDLTSLGETWFETKFNKSWDGYFSLMETKYNPNNPLEQYYNELKKAEEHLQYLNTLI